jgi:RHS repeat-associated protein
MTLGAVRAVRFMMRAVGRVLGGFVSAGCALLVVAGTQLVPVSLASSASARDGGAANATVTSAGSALAAMKAARAQHSRVEIMAARTAYSQTFANPNGTTTYQASWIPRWVERGSRWVPVNADLARGKDGSWSPTAAEASLRFSGGGTKTLATARSGENDLSVSWPSVLPAPVISGPHATYKNVFPSVDLVVTAQVTGGFDETLVIRDRAAAADPQLRNLNLGVSESSRLSRHAARDGSALMETVKGQPVFASPPPVAWDSSVAGSGATGPGRGGKLTAVAAVYTAGSLHLGMPAALLASPSVTFPVYVDPSYQVVASTLAYAMVAAGQPTTSYWDAMPSTGMGVGYGGSTYGAERSFFRMSVPTALQGATVLSATFTGTVTHTTTATSTSHTVSLWSAGAISSSTTWNTMPAHGAGSLASATFTTASTAPNLNVSWNVASQVQSVITTGSANWTAELINSTETAAANWAGFSASPTISITYDHAPSAPSVQLKSQYQIPNGNIYTGSLWPTFQATATDPDGDAITYQFTVEQGSTVVESGSSASVTSGTTGSWPATTGLTDGTQYTIVVKAYDGTEYSGSASETFTTDAATPAAPTVSCSGYPSGTWSPLISGGTTCTFSDSSPMILGYEYGLQDGNGATTWTWTYNATVTINPTEPGLYHLIFGVDDDAFINSGDNVTYDFGVGSAGAMVSPADSSQTSSTISLQAAAPAGYIQATFEYRLGTTGSFQVIPDSDVSDGSSGVTWPVSTSADSSGTATDALTWYATRTLADDGPVQIEAVFTDGSGGTDTTQPVTVTLNRIGTGADYGTTTAGPVTIGLQSGNAAVSATDVNIASYGTSLQVTRTFNSVEPDTASIFGWGWTSSLTGGETTPWTQITDDSNYVVLTATDGSNDTFTAGATSNGVTSYDPQGDTITSGVTLTKNTSANTFTLTDSSGTATTFVQANTAAGYVPQNVTVPGDSSSSGIVYDGNSSSATYGDPLLMVAPDAASSAAPTTACPYPASASTWTAGCRGLTFTYNSNQDVSQISFAYVGNDGNFHNVPVADYSYDTAGRLISEWDPRLATPLVTGYGYDETASDDDYGRITEVTPAQSSGSGALASWFLGYNDTSGNAAYGKITTVSRTHDAADGGGTATTTINYDIPLSVGGGGPANLDQTSVSGWGQTDIPASAVAIFPPGYAPSQWPPTETDYQHATIDYYDASGHEVNTATYVNGDWAITTTQYDAYGNVTSTLGAQNLDNANGAADAQALSTVNVYGCDDFGTINPCAASNEGHLVLIDTYGPAHQASVDGTVETIRTHTAYIYDQGAPNGDTNDSGDPYMLTTSETVSASVGATLPGSATADARTTSYTYGSSSTSIGWTLGTPLTTVNDPGGLNITSTTAYNTNANLYGGANLQTDSDMPSNTSGGGAGDTQTVYYTAGTNPAVAACGNKPEWANLTCQTGPAAQPGTSGLPSLPVTTYTYDDYLSVTTKTETFGSTGTRVTTTGYDAGERAVSMAITVTGTGMGTSVPKQRTVYAADSGLPTDTQTLDSSGNVTADINTSYDDFGNTRTYTDASGVTTTYSYDISDRVTGRSEGTGQDSDTVGYDGASGTPNKIVDSEAGTFTATWDADGNLLTENYPGGITATRTYDETGAATSLSYSGQDWSAPLADTVVPNAAGDWVNQSITDTATSLVSTQNYAYDNADRISTVQDTLAGQCTTRSYGYDVDSNRTSLTSYTPNSDGSCQATTGTATTSTYDSADRVTDSGYGYDTQGDITTSPSAAAGGGGDLTAAYYANDMLANQTQNGASMTWSLDPTLGRFGSYTQNGVTYTNHYSDTSNNPTWVSSSDGSWISNVTDFNGLLAAEVTTSGTTIELPDLHGDIMATATTNSTATGPTATYVYTEFGTCESGTPGTYGWLGANQISSNTPGGQLLMGARTYNVNTGRFSQTDPIPGGSANAYDYALQNPMANLDLAGSAVSRHCIGVSKWVQYCLAYYDHFSTLVYIRHLATMAAIYGYCADWAGKLPYHWAEVLSHYCLLQQIRYKGLEDLSQDILMGCGGEPNPTSGLVFFEADWRYAWWVFGWHYSRWHTYVYLPVTCRR